MKMLERFLIIVLAVCVLSGIGLFIRACGSLPHDAEASEVLGADVDYPDYENTYLPKQEMQDTAIALLDGRYKNTSTSFDNRLTREKDIRSTQIVALNNLTGIIQRTTGAKTVNYYVDWRIGNDNNPGTIDLPKKTFQSVVDDYITGKVRSCDINIFANRTGVYDSFSIANAQSTGDYDINIYGDNTNEDYEGSTTSIGSTTTLINTNQPDITDYIGLDPFVWIKSGANNGVYRRVTNWDNVSKIITFGDPFPTPIDSGISYKIYLRGKDRSKFRIINGFGITVAKSNNINVYGFKIWGGNTGIKYTGSTGTVYQCILTDTNYYGLKLQDNSSVKTYDSLLVENTINDNVGGGAGVLITNCVIKSSFNRTSFRDNINGILTLSGNASLIHCSVSNNLGGIIYTGGLFADEYSIIDNWDTTYNNNTNKQVCCSSAEVMLRGSSLVSGTNSPGNFGVYCTGGGAVNFAQTAYVQNCSGSGSAGCKADKHGTITGTSTVTYTGNTIDESADAASFGYID